MQFSQEERRRYARHLVLPQVGPEGQARLRQAQVLCVGAGGLGSPVALYLSAAGVGRIGVVDFDPVELSNLQRQILHGTDTLGQPKVVSARQSITRLNPLVQVDTHAVRLTRENALEILRPYDLVVDCTDNFAGRYLINDASVALRKPHLYGAVRQFEGQATVFAPHRGGPCYRCLFPEPPPPEAAPNCAEAGVLGVLPGIIGCLQATEALKLILGQGELLIGRLLLLDALAMKFREIKVRPDPACPACGKALPFTDLVDYGTVCQKR